VVKRNSAVESTGGAEAHACRLSGRLSTFPCLYVDTSQAQGFRGWTEGPDNALPLAVPFYVFTLEDGKQRYEVRYWLAAKAGIDRDFLAIRSYGVRATDGLEWVDNPRTLCDVTERLGNCDEQANLSQFRSDGATIPVGGVTYESTVKLRGLVSDLKGKQSRLEIELRQLSEHEGQFTGESTQVSASGASGRVAEVVVYGLTNGQYHWQARTVNAIGERSPWLSFGNNPDRSDDFTVSVGGTCSPTVFLAQGILRATPCESQPQISDQSALDIDETSATLKANIKPNGSVTTAMFEYWTSTSSIRTTPPQTVGSDIFTKEVRQSIAGLACGTTYQFRTIATNSVGRTEDAFQFFRTSICPPNGAPPQVTTKPAIEFGPTSINLQASINPNGSKTSALFEYGVTTSSLSSTGPEQLDSASTTRDFSQFVTGLTCNTSYYYRAVALNAFGRQEGVFLTFSTAACPQQYCFLLSFKRDPIEGGDIPLASLEHSTGCAPGRYNPGERILVTARPAPGWSVKEWTGTQEESSSLTNTVSMSSYDLLVWVYYRRPCERSFTEPAGGDVWKKGEPHTIRWTWGGCGESVRIELIKGGVLYDTITTLPASAETFTWTPALSYSNASNYQIKVVDASDPNILTMTHFFALSDP
jgi:hypothetical protein